MKEKGIDSRGCSSSMSTDHAVPLPLHAMAEGSLIALVVLRAVLQPPIFIGRSRIILSLQRTDASVHAVSILGLDRDSWMPGRKTNIEDHAPHRRNHGSQQ